MESTDRGITQNHIIGKLPGMISRRVYYSMQNLIFMIGAKLRMKSNTVEKKYERLRQLKNSHTGERCFIIATGPSLRLLDVESLGNEFTFAMNNVCLLYDQTDWRPSFYGIQDWAVYEKLRTVLQKNSENVFVSSEIAKRFHDAQMYDQFPINSFYLMYDYRYTNKLPIKFSDNAYSVVYDAYSITFSLMQIAVYMGFKEIYLLGCDCNQAVGKKNHFIETEHIEDDDKLRTSAQRNIYAHRMIKSFCEERGVKVYNATRGGSLEVYERVNLDEIIRR